MNDFDAGSPGASARREYERRSTRERARKQAAIDADLQWRQDVIGRHPIAGRLQAAVKAKPVMTPESQATKAWAAGAIGERRVAEVLDQSGVGVLHDRRIPGSRANVDHIAIGPAGVFVIDAKKYKGRVESRDIGSWLRSDIHLFVNGRDRTKLIDGVERQCDVVRKLLDDPHVPVIGVLCFVDAEWPGLLGRRVHVRNVICLWPNALRKLVTSDGGVSTERVDRTVHHLATVLKPA